MPIKNNIFVIMIMILCLVIGSVLQSQSQIWDQYYGEPNRWDIAEEIVETYDNGYLICGNLNSNKSWLIKTDMNGDTLWEKVIESEGKNRAFSASQSPDGGFIVVGRASIFENITDPYILKLDACGEKEWCNILRKPDQLAYAEKILIKEDGSIFVLTYGMGDPEKDRIHIYHFDESGLLLWKNAYATIYDYPLIASPWARSMFFTNDSGILITGYCYYPDINNPNGLKGIRPMFIKVDKFGEEEWMLPFGYSLGVLGESNHFIELENGRFWGLGVRLDDVTPAKPMLMKFSSTGVEQDYFTINTDTLFNGLLAGSFYYGFNINDSTILADIPFVYEPTGPINLGTILMDTLGNIVKTKKYLKNATPHFMKPMGDFSFIISANSIEEGQEYKTDIHVFKIRSDLEPDSISSSSQSYDSLCPAPIQSGYIYLDDCDIIVGMDEIPSPAEYQVYLSQIPITIYPNPAKQLLNFGFENTENHAELKLKCYDLFGRNVYTEKLVKGQKEKSILVSSWSAGFYIAIVTSRGKVVGNAKFVVQK